MSVSAEPLSPSVKMGEAQRLTNKLFVGASAGIIGTSIIYPLDVLKTKIQTSTSRISITQFSSILRTTLQAGGLYRGFSACLVGIAPEKAIKLAINDTMRDYFTEGQSKPIFVSHEVISGSVAGFLQLFVTVPYEGIKIKLQMNKGAPISALQLIRDTKSPLELYRGFTATLIRDVPFCFLYFPLYAHVKHLQMKWLHADKREEPFQVGLIAGIVAGAISAVVVTPADMLKTRIQQGLNGNTPFFQYGMAVLRTEGGAALYKGWQARMFVIAPLYGIISLAFEVQKRWLGM